MKQQGMIVDLDLDLDLETMTAQDVVDRQLQAYNAHDLEAFLACYSPTVTVALHPGGQILDEGLGALRLSYAKLFTECPHLHAHITRRITSENLIIDEEEVEGLVDGPSVRSIVMYEVTDGLITRTWFVE
ncbi:nuclear transport factor 2 family protein [Ktedonobacter robiniae]|uniref:Steroid Delta-isomerase n=1 Tax=Ktedonobacter robiniae TaxID=2778365 RepID=A0ABQ3UJ80_9CHLR|nr:nuclear transport factor 2 family protein [Ktedonobacter robiniae]GHO52774.1 steroid Delta-isomerase [Ktedonobacter robiniae]